MSSRLVDAAIRRALEPTAEVGAPEDFSVTLRESIDAVRQESPRWWINPMRSGLPGVVRIAALLLLLLGLLIGFLLAGVQREETGPNGLLMVVTGGEMRAINVESGSSVPMLASPDIFQVTRSPDGRYASFWTHQGTVDWLEIVETRAGDARRVAEDFEMRSAGCIDHWAPTSKRFAVTANDVIARAERILVVDLSGAAQFITSPELHAACPIWSPDGEWLAFAASVDGRRHVMVARSDGTDLRDVSGDLEGADASGANAWSGDGRYVYFDAKEPGEHSGQGRIYRADVVRGKTDLVFGPDRVGDAPQLSPDGAWLTFNAENRDGVIDLWRAAADGSDATILLRDAVSAGWSTDGRFVLAESHSQADGPHGGLVVIRPDGSDRRVVLPFPASCLPYQCVEGLSWGQSRP